MNQSRVVKFLSRLRKLNIQVIAEGETLRYRAPKGVLTAELRQEIAEYKPEILAFVNTVEGKVKSALPPIQVIPRNQPLPLSFGQERLWFLDQLEGSTAYNEHGGIRIIGELDVSAIQRAFTEVLRRHEVLRTTFPLVDGMPQQAIAPEATAELTQLDWQHLSQSDRESRLSDYAQQQAQMRVDLAAGPLVYATLIHLAPDEWVLLIVMHHIICDYWSIGIFIQELSALYQSFSQQKPSQLPELVIQYADYAHWQRHRLNGEWLESQLSYWKQQLANAPSLLKLPTDRPRPSVQRYRGEAQTFMIDPWLTQQLQDLSQRCGTTLFMTLLAAFSTLLYRYSAQEDILIGSPIANRNRAEIEPLIGFIANILVLRVRLEDNPRFIQLLEQVRDVTLQGYAHQDLPFEQVVEALQPDRSLSYSPLFQVLFVFQNVPKEPLVLPGVTLNPFAPKTQTAKFDLTLMIEESEQGLIGTWKYNTDLFNPETIARMAGHFQTLLSAIATAPEQRVSQFPLLSEQQKYQLLVEWNQTAADYPQDKCIHQLFEAQVEQTPDAVAVVCEDHHLTYSELNRRANQLAYDLQGLGVGLEVLVGICFERSVEIIVALLGILKAGGAYVPLDPTYPPERLHYMLSDSQVLVLLTQPKFLDLLPPSSAHVICLDIDNQNLDAKSQENPVCRTHAHNLAYVIYTSGSTGKPKGVAIEQKSILNYHYGVTDRMTFQPNRHFALAATISADSGLTTIFACLSTGGTLHLLCDQRVFDPDAFADYFTRHPIDYFKIVPSHLAALQTPTTQQSVLPQKLLILGGESSNADWVQRLQAQAPTCTIFNHYGPTEATVGVLVYQVEDKSELSQYSQLPLGRPLANTQIYILDSELQPVPIGVPGELHIGGVYLARGYLNRPDLTALKFIPNPFSQEPGSRLYKTGDLARYLPDGTIELLGRIDLQVKIRGFRIELTEIEAILSEHPQVQTAAVIARSETSGDKRLVGYVVVNHEPAPPISELRHFLKQHLPEYMIPTTFVVLAELPLLANGKLDRQALPEPEVNGVRETEFVPPQTPIEQTLAVIWQEVLDLPPVSRHDNFFAIGGDSILSIQVVSRAKQMGLQITPKQLFQYQTLAELAAVANTTTGVVAQQQVVTGDIPLTPIQTWFFEQNWSEPHHFNQSVLLQVSHTFQAEVLCQAVSQLLEHHDALRLRFHVQAGNWQQINNGREDTVPFESVDLSDQSPSQQSRAIEDMAAARQASLNLSVGPLMRVILFKLGSNREGRLLIIIHHLAVDAVSWRILIEDLLRVYQQLEQGESRQLPPKTTAFQDWSRRLRDYAQSRGLQQQLQYWLNLPWSNVAPLPRDEPTNQQQNTVANAADVSVALAQKQTDALLQEVSVAYNTQINDVLLTALVQTLKTWTGNSAILIDLEAHGREDLFEAVDVSRTVGWFTSIFPVLLQDANSTEPGDQLKAIKEQLRAIPDRGIGYGILRYLSQDRKNCRQLKALPQAEIRFNYFGQLLQETVLGVSWQLNDRLQKFDRSPQGNRPYLLDINAMIVEGELQITWTYCPKIHYSDTVKQLANHYQEALQGLIDHCLSPEAKGYTPSDFPEAGLNQQELDSLLEEVGL